MKTSISLAARLRFISCAAPIVACNAAAPPDAFEPIGGRDHPSNQTLEVHPEGVVGDVSGRTLSLEIPVSARRSGNGALKAFIGKVDGEPVSAERRIGYHVDKGETETLTAELELPEVDEQAGVFEYNLFLSDGGELFVSKSLLHVLGPYEVQLEGPSKVVSGKPASYRVSARDPSSKTPLENRRVTLSVASGGEVVEQFSADTEADGNASFQVDLEAAGEVQIAAGAASARTEERVAQSIEVASRDAKVLLTTDKPVYKPGQTLHLRALSLRRGDNAPLAEAPVRFVLEDGKGNKILERELESDAHGIAATSFALGRILNEGTFAVRAIVDGQTAQKTVTVAQYALPKFQIALQTDRPWYEAGETVHVVVDARYFFGKVVSGGSVELSLGAAVAGEQIFDRVMAQTDEAGRFEAALRLPNVLPGLEINSGNALAFVRATVTDAAGQEVEREQALTVANSPVRVAIIPESTALVPGLENRLLVFVQDPLGAPLGDADVSVEYQGQRLVGTTDGNGYTELTYEPGETAESAVATVSAPGETPVVVTFAFEMQSGEDHLILRTDKAVYEVGDSVEIEVFTSQDAGFVFIDWLNAGQAVDMQTLMVEDGRATTQKTLDGSLLGDNRISAYVVDSGGDVVRTGKSLFVRDPGSLAITLATDKPRYEPGESARLTFDVRDETGAPQVAALGVQIVDEAVFNVIDARPGLLRTYFELEQEFSEPSYQLRAPGGSLAELFAEASSSENPDASRAAQTRVEANLAALDEPLSLGVSVHSWPETVARGRALLEPYYARQKRHVVARSSRVASDAVNDALDQGCRPSDYWCEALDATFSELVRERLLDQVKVFDFWGNRYQGSTMNHDEALRLVSRGPDELANTGDEGTIVVRFSDLTVELDSGGGRDAGAVDFDDLVEPEAEPAGDDDAADDDAEPPDDDEAPSGDTPRVRRDFPETLYVNPALITGPDGTATIDVELADSITQWRVSSLANTASGRLGGAISGVTVFQDFFVDIDFPAQLTRGDELDFPIAVYNYLDESQTITVELTPEDWYAALGETTRSVELEPGQVAGVSFPVRVERVGMRTLTVTALGANKSDAVARTVLVVPDGKAFPHAQSGSLAQDPVIHTVSFPDGAIEGSEELYIDVFPAFLAQAVQGMDSVLQVPSGCFEQTTSTTWPNVLVTRYMQETDQITEEILLRAEALISSGYQRLLTFEHPGGGFSWFGTSDPAPFLSVTAFGLMEFTDMTPSCLREFVAFCRACSGFEVL